MASETCEGRRCVMHRRGARVRHVALWAFIFLLGAMATAGPALAEPTVTLCFDSTGAGRNVRGWLPGQTTAQTYWAGVFNVRIGGASARAFCIDIHNSISRGTCYPSSTFGVTAGWVARTIADYPATAGLTNLEAAARQAAIWYFSDGLVLDPTYDASLYVRTQAIIEDIEAKCSSGACDPLVPVRLSLDPASEVNWLAPDGQGGYLEDEHLLTVAVMRGSASVAGAEVTVSTTLGQLSWESETGSSITIETGADGTATVVLTHDAIGTAVITAEHVATFPVGTIINPGIDVQKVVIGESFDYTLTATATKQWEEGERLIVQKFHDVNGNGIQDDGEQLIDWTISYREHGSGDPWTTVELGADGAFVLSGPPSTSWDIREEPRSGWLATTPTLVEGVTSPAIVKFGNLELSTIVVSKFHDLDGDGLRGPDEPGLSGWSYSLYRDTPDGWSSSGFATTGSTGLAGFSNLAPNNYRIVELTVSGWYTSTPHIVDVAIDEGAVYTAAFGNLQPGTITLNKTWLWDGEPTDAPETRAVLCVRRTGPGTPSQNLVPLDGGGAPLSADAGGWYCQPVIDQVVFQRLWPGVYEVSEQSPDGWEVASVDDITVLSGGTESRTVENNRLPGDLTVTKVVQWGDVTPDEGQEFVITITGPSYPSGDSKTVGYDGGDATWTGLAPGTYTVSEVDPGVAWSVEGDGVEVEVAGGVSATATITNTVRVGSIAGVKYNDLNGNGTRDQGEPGIAGWVIELIGPAGSYTATTTVDGSYSFDNLPAGAYTLCEGEGPWLTGSYDQTEPADGACHSVTVGSDDVWQIGDVDFGNHLIPTFECVSIYGHKWHDLNGDGVWDDGEPGLEGWVISLTDGERVITTTTDAEGSYSFEVCEPSTYTVSEQMREGWAASTPTSVEFEATSGQDVGPIDFGNYQPFECVSIYGHKWHDLNGDGVWDDGEPGLEGWVISLTDGERVITTTTDTEGSYSFEVCEPSTYTVSEQMREGWVASTPVEVSVTIEQESVRVDFGNRTEPQQECGVVHGFKWNDLNGDGVWQQGEPALQGWEIVLERVMLPAAQDTSNGTGRRVTHTDANGYYRFEDICEPGLYRVYEVQQDGWVATTPMLVELEAAWGGTTRVDFGNRLKSGDNPTPEPCIRSDVSLIIYGGWNDIAVKAWVGGTEQETLFTKLNSFGEPQVMWTFYPPEAGRWEVRVQPQLPAGLDPTEWEFKLVRIESPTEGWIHENPASGVVSIQRCEQYVIYYQLVHTGARTPVPTPWELPQTGSGAELPPALNRDAVYALLGLNLLSGAYLVLRRKWQSRAK